MLHIAEDFRMRFIPTAQDYLKHLEVQEWFCNGVKDVDNAESIETADLFLQKLREERLTEKI